ncbi:MAG: sigma-70 family RNA polymerase sigma factor [Pirellulales bacterium]
MADRAAPLDVGQLVAEHHASLYRYAYRLAGTAADAEDLTQQVFLIAQQKLDQLRDADCVRGWLFTVLRNCYLKNRRRRTPISAATAELDINTVAEEVVEREIDGERLQAAIDTLEDEFKTTLLLFYFEHRSYREIAAALGIPIGTVMSRLARAKARLRGQLCDAAESRAPHDGEQHVKRPAYSTLEPRRVTRQ